MRLLVCNGARMESVRESWTDERLDDFRANVDHRFDRFKVELREHRAETRASFERIDQRFDRVDERFEALHRLMVQFALGMLVTMIGLFSALAGLFATQL